LSEASLQLQTKNRARQLSKHRRLIRSAKYITGPYLHSRIEVAYRAAIFKSRVPFGGSWTEPLRTILRIYFLNNLNVNGRNKI
jgi:hypothetical protein